MCRCTWCSCRFCDARPAVVLHPLADMGKQLQCHIWFVCGIADVYVMGADIMADMSFRCRAMLCQPKHGRLCLQNKNRRPEPQIQDAVVHRADKPDMQTLRQRRQALLSPRPQAANRHTYTYSQRAVVRIVANTHPNRNNKWRQRRDNPLPTSRMSHPSFCRNNHRPNGSIRQVDIRYRYETACLPSMEKDNCKPKRISNRTKTSDA